MISIAKLPSQSDMIVFQSAPIGTFFDHPPLGNLNLGNSSSRNVINISSCIGENSNGLLPQVSFFTLLLLKERLEEFLFEEWTPLFTQASAASR